MADPDQTVVASIRGITVSHHMRAPSMMFGG